MAEAVSNVALGNSSVALSEKRGTQDVVVMYTKLKIIEILQVGLC